MLKSAAIVLLCIALAIGYGIIHDQITARICVEYFTIGHPDIFGTQNPTLLGLGWGVIATWWVGLMLGVPLAFAARFGRRPKRDARSLVRPLLALLGIMAVCAAVCGVAGYIAAGFGWVYLVNPMAGLVPSDRHRAFLTDLWIHSGSYGAGIVGGIVLCALVWRSRHVRSVNLAGAD